MPVKKPFLLYLRSRLNSALSVVAASLVVLSLLFLRPYALLPIIVILLAYSALTGALFFSRRGAREVVAESEEDRLKKVRDKIDASVGIRERVSVLRIGDDRMAKAIEYFLQESGSYLEKCRELSSYSPLANERIERVLEICQVFLGELDETATARRYDVSVERGTSAYGVPAERGTSAYGVPAERGTSTYGVPAERDTPAYGVPAETVTPPTNPGERFARDIMECARVIKDRTTEDLLGLSGEARLAIMKELEANK